MFTEDINFEVLDFTNNQYKNLKPELNFSAKNIAEAESWQKLLKSKLRTILSSDLELITKEGPFETIKERLNSTTI